MSINGLNQTGSIGPLEQPPVQAKQNPPSKGSLGLEGKPTSVKLNDVAKNRLKEIGKSVKAAPFVASLIENAPIEKKLDEIANRAVKALRKKEESG